MVTPGRVGGNWCWILVWIFFCGQLAAAITSPPEIQSLLALKSSLTDKYGRLASWDSRTDPCSSPWQGVFCLSEDYPSSLVGSNYSHVTELRLLSLNLTGELVDELGNLPALKYLDVMWNNLSGSIPPGIGNCSNLLLLLLNGNSFTGALPPELGVLPNLIRMQIDQNQISGQIPSTFVNLTKIQHLHMNNNSLNGSIPEGLGSLPNLLHVLLDNNQLTGTLPEDLSKAPSLLIIQLDNNQFSAGATIPTAYAQIPTLLKLSLRNCSLQGTIPDFSGSPKLAVLDLSSNNLTGPIPTTALPVNMTSIDLSYNRLNGSVPDSFGNLSDLQYLEVRNNLLFGDIPPNLGTGPSFFNTSSPIILDFQYNSLELANTSNLAKLQGEEMVQVWLAGNANACTGPANPLCIPTNVSAFLDLFTEPPPPPPSSAQNRCPPCDSPYVLAPSSNSNSCRCAYPIIVDYRLKSPGFTVFDEYEEQFLVYISEGLNLTIDQVQIPTYTNQPGPRIAITLWLFPTSSDFNTTELDRINSAFTDWRIPDSTIFGPYELLGFIRPSSGSGGRSTGLSTGAKAGISIAGVILTSILAATMMFCYLKRRGWDPKASKHILMTRSGLRSTIKVAGVRTFTFEELVQATDNFSKKNELGKGGYGKVYFGVLKDGQKVAVKRAEEGSLQGAREFETEIQLLSRVHHRNLVALVGYCNDDGEHSQGEQMLVYEYISNGTLRDHLNKTTKFPLDMLSRLRIALGSARGVHYLHTQADPPIFHRDIKATNILLDEKYNAKVADFGLSKLAPSDVDFEGANAGHVSTLVKGTPGYLDPEYFLTHKLTDKSDVYSFGVVLLELITGMPPISQGKNIVREVSMAFVGGGMTQITDPSMGEYPSETIEPLTRLALSCCSSETGARPSMAEVLHELEDIWKGTPWSDVASHSYVGDLGDSEDLPLHRGYSSDVYTSLYDRSEDGSTSDLLSHTNINVLPR